MIMNILIMLTMRILILIMILMMIMLIIVLGLLDDVRDYTAVLAALGRAGYYY